MAEIFQIIDLGDNDPAHRILFDGTWHVAINTDDPRTVCGVQLCGEDGVGSSPTKEGKVTCQICRKIVREIQKIKNWE